MMKVALLCILLFVPPSIFTGGKMVFGAVVVLIQAFLAGNFTPFSDGMESMMELFSGLTNNVNCIIGISIAYGWNNQLIQDLILFAANLINLGIIGFTLVVSPIRTYLFIAKFKLRERLLQEQKLKEYARDQLLEAQKHMNNSLEAVMHSTVVKSGLSIADAIGDKLAPATDKVEAFADMVSEKVSDATGAVVEELTPAAKLAQRKLLL